MVRLRQSGVTEVDVLILEDNNIPHLPSRAFGSVKVNRLFIENNRMMTVDRNALAGLEEFLKELYIKVSFGEMDKFKIMLWKMLFNFCRNL